MRLVFIVVSPLLAISNQLSAFSQGENPQKQPDAAEG
jgi:hypothetical protein